MFLEELEVFNFRNLAKQKLKFSNNPTVFYGDNAQGKTNLLEAVYLLSTTRSFRTRSDRELIAWGEKESKIIGKTPLLEIEVLIREDRKDFKVNKQNKKVTEIIGSFICVVFSPTDTELVSSGPEKRRKFLDQLGSNLNKEYLLQLVRFNKTLRSRNQILFNLKQGKKADLWVWDKQLAKRGSYLWVERKNLVHRLNEELQKIGRKLTGNELKIIYRPGIDKETRSQTEENYLKKLELLREQEIAKGVTTMGPHRDDFKILLEEEKQDKVISKDLGVYGSRGEQRTAALGLKLSEVSLLEKERGEKPVLLLDEVLSELDQKHRTLLLNLLKKEQSFITTTSLEAVEKVLGKNLKKFFVESGIAKQV